MAFAKRKNRVTRCKIEFFMLVVFPKIMLVEGPREDYSTNGREASANG
jgi:hypothetical protein